MNLGRHAGKPFTSKRRFAGEQKQERAAHAVEVTAKISAASIGCLFWREEIDGSQKLPGVCQPVGILLIANESKVEQSQGAVSINDQIGRLDIAMDESMRMSTDLPLPAAESHAPWPDAMGLLRKQAGRDLFRRRIQ